METLELASGFLCYRFPPRPGRHFGFNLYALLSGTQALLIDTGFPKHARAVLADLAARGVQPVGVILSHFHHDHVFGLRALPRLEVYGSARYLDTFRRYPPPAGDGDLFRPTRLLAEDTTLAFGAFQLRFLVMPGHAECNTYTLIDEAWLHVGDDLMASNQGEPLLPSVEGERLGDHIASLERLRQYRQRTFLPAHGLPLRGAELIGAALAERLAYLEAVRKAWPERIPVEAATAGCSAEFLHQEWHEDLYP